MIGSNKRERLVFIAFFLFPLLLLLLLCPPLSQVLVPLVLLQALQSKGQSMTTLVHLGVRFLEEDASGYIIQQGGWVSFKHAMEEDHHMLYLCNSFFFYYVNF